MHIFKGDEYLCEVLYVVLYTRLFFIIIVRCIFCRCIPTLLDWILAIFFIVLSILYLFSIKTLQTFIGFKLIKYRIYMGPCDHAVFTGLWLVSWVRLIVWNGCYICKTIHMSLKCVCACACVFVLVYISELGPS